ncbi:hypothetical protein ABZU32_08845 [Sphaerisporangium sp. NPDC005288]|uniref:hypothetical protein n=1 Tax=Sphaerisporangium sp. NPDC005288 TaxID=3155114 RepID=UPI0033A5437E
MAPTTTTASAPAPASALVRHRPVIARGVTDLGHTSYRLDCSCGTTSKEHSARRLAEWDLGEHVATLPKVPAGQQCRDAKRHDRRHWEPCTLCAGQASLFDLGAEVTA